MLGAFEKIKNELLWSQNHQEHFNVGTENDSQI